MQRILLFVVLAFCLFASSWMTAQTPPSDFSSNHVEIGAFADYFRLATPTPAINFVGAGGALGF